MAPNTNILPQAFRFYKRKKQKFWYKKDLPEQNKGKTVVKFLAQAVLQKVGEDRTWKTMQNPNGAIGMLGPSAYYCFYYV